MKKQIPPKFDRSNMPWKVREIKAGKIIPVVKKCIKCGAKVKYHHVLCTKCWIEKKNKQTIKEDIK